jgi:hypothetical protein
MTTDHAAAAPPDTPLARLGRDLEGAGVLLQAARRHIAAHLASPAASGCALNRRLENLDGALGDLIEDLASAQAPLAREPARAQEPEQGV